MRLDKALSLYGIGTRQEVKNLIKRGQVSVNGMSRVSADMKVSEEDEIIVSGEKLLMNAYEYYILYKPSGYLTATEDKHRPVVMDLVPSKRKDLSPVGRLDLDTEGLLFITNDGTLNHLVLSPKRHVKKKYYVEVDKDLPDTCETVFKEGIQFEEFTSLPAEFEKLSSRSAYLTIMEGKYHQVKRMFHHVGCEVTYLRRETFGDLSLEGMKKGDVRALSNEEVEHLYLLVK